MTLLPEFRNHCDEVLIDESTSASVMSYGKLCRITSKISKYGIVYRYKYMKYCTADFLKLCSVGHKFWEQLIHVWLIHLRNAVGQTFFMNMHSSQ